MNHISINFTDEQLQKIKRVAQINGVDVDTYLEGIVKKNVESTVYLNNGFIYDNKNKVLLDSNKEIIELTKSELMIFDYLIKNRNRYISIDELSTLLPNKTMSVFTLRNKIRYIREKTFDEIIENKKLVGYKIL